MPPEPPTEAGTVLRPRLIPLNVQPGAPSPPEPWDPKGFAESSSRQLVWSTIDVDGEPVRVLSVPFPPRGPVESVLQMPYPLSEVERAVSGLIGTLLALAPVALLAAAAGGYALTGRALRPVARITAAAEQIGARDLERRIPVEGEDEFARLAATFNGMLARLDLAFDERERLIAQLREAVEQQRRFTADASHELKTPLTAIKANTSLLLSGSPTAEEYHEATAEIDEAAGAMSRLVQDLLLLARSDAGQVAREKTAVLLVEPIQRAAAQIRKTAAAPICVDVPPHLIVNGHEDALARLFANLLDNAARHTPADGAITVKASEDCGFAVVSVIDTGSGIASEHLPHLGERFYRVDAHRARAYGGSGLGLAICREIAAAHNGDLSITSEVGKGTTVTIRLPVV
jgi:signal transduction histidine kinase